MAASIQNLEQTAVATGQMFEPILVTISSDNTVADIQIPLAGNGDNTASLAALHTLGATVVPQTVGRAPRASSTPLPARRQVRTTSTS